MSSDKETPPNGDTQEIVGPEGCEVPVASTERPVAEALGVDESTEFSLRDELAESFPIEPIVVGINPDDGLPEPMDKYLHLPLAPKFSPQTMVCLEDESEYVELFAEETGSRELFNVRPRFRDDGVENERQKFKPSEVVGRWGKLCVSDGNGSWIRVRPKRERCEHYRRMVFANDETSIKPGEFGHQIVYRNCEARRSVGGAMMSISNEAIYACEHRFPADPATVETYLDKPDRERVAKKVEMVPLFNLP